MGGVGTLMEVKKRWTLDDLMDAHELLDAKAAAEAQMMQKARGSR